jgi:hypothetical protein
LRKKTDVKQAKGIIKIKGWTPRNKTARPSHSLLPLPFTSDECLLHALSNLDIGGCSCGHLVSNDLR